MEQFINGAILGLYTISIIIAIAALPTLIYLLAKNDIFFTIVKEGTAKIVTYNEQFHRVIMSNKGCRFKGGSGANAWDIEEAPEGEEPDEGILGGLRFVGMWPFFKVHKYKFTWTSLENGELKSHKDELLGHIFVKYDVYVISLDKVELRGNIPVDFKILFTARIKNPFKALFRVERWLESTQNRISAELRRELGGLSVEELVAWEGESEKIKKILENLSALKDSFVRDTCGIEPDKKDPIDIHSFDVDPAWIEITRKKIEAEEEAKATKIRAEAEKEKRLKEGEGRAGAIRSVNDSVLAYGDNGLTLRTLEAIENAGANVTLVSPDAHILPMVDVAGSRKKHQSEEKPVDEEGA